MIFRAIERLVGKRESETMEAVVSLEVSEDDGHGGRTVEMEVSGLGEDFEDLPSVYLSPDDGFEFTYNTSVEMPPGVDIESFKQRNIDIRDEDEA